MWKLTLLLVIGCVIIGIVVYHMSRPKITIHTEFESDYLGKVSEFDGNIVRLIVENNKVLYRLPHTYQWKEDDEIAIFTLRYNDIFHRYGGKCSCRHLQSINTFFNRIHLFPFTISWFYRKFKFLIADLLAKRTNANHR